MNFGSKQTSKSHHMVCRIACRLHGRAFDRIYQDKISQLKQELIQIQKGMYMFIGLSDGELQRGGSLMYKNFIATC